MLAPKCDLLVVRHSLKGILESDFNSSGPEMALLNLDHQSKCGQLWEVRICRVSRSEKIDESPSLKGAPVPWEQPSRSAFVTLDYNYQVINWSVRRKMDVSCAM